MSANRTSSSAKSERKPEGEEEELGEEGEEEMSTRPPGGSVGRVSIGRSSAQRPSTSKTPSASGLAPTVLQSLAGPMGVGDRATKRGVSGIGVGEVVTVVVLAAAVLVMAVEGPNSMSLKLEVKQSLDETGKGILVDAWLRSDDGNGGG